ncbi:MAG: DUF4419 domain-containing protein [Deltaproteobacteria bacterium]|nr:DUF4419 domain-containing protein [Deltaproteobacteria bacterium]
MSERIQACTRAQGPLVATVQSHPLIAALHDAFAEHRPLVLSPDVVWLTLLQGVAHHVNMNAEEVRRQILRHDDKLTIKVSRDDFIMGSPDNRWPEVFSEFSRAIHDHIGEMHGLILADFSTTDEVARAASEVALLDTMQAFFDYEMRTRCGIPTITLEGTVEDWKSIVRRMQELRRLGLDWWVNALTPILEKIVATAAGTVDQAFWRSIYKWDDARGSGSPHVSGWILNLFPYLDNPRTKFATRIMMAYKDDVGIRLQYVEDAKGPRLIRNRWLGITGLWHEGPGRDDFPRLPSRAPFKWIYLGETFPMQFVAGLVGVRQEPESLCLRPEIGWAVLQSEDDGSDPVSNQNRGE